MFWDVLFRIVKNCKSSKHPSVEEEFKNYISKTGIDTAIKNTSGDKDVQLIWKNISKILFLLYSLFCEVTYYEKGTYPVCQWECHVH